MSLRSKSSLRFADTALIESKSLLAPPALSGLAGTWAFHNSSGAVRSGFHF